MKKGNNKYKLSLPKGLKPLPFQKEGVAQAIDFDNRALIADSMGLGKTIQAICWLNCQPWLRPALIITPATAKIKWTRTLKEWLALTDDKILMLSGMKAKKQLTKDVNIVICNYDILKNHKIKKQTKNKTSKKHLYNELKKIKFKALVIDECHYLANVESQRTKIISYLSTGIPNIVALSGTPIPSRPVQFFPTLHILKPNIFSNIWKFRHRYCGAKKTFYGWDFSGASHIEELHNILIDNVMIRRTKKDVIKDLPPKVRSIEPLEIDNRKDYEEAEKDFISWLQKKGKHDQAEKAKKSTALARIEGLKQICLAGKTKAVIEWIQSFLDNSDNEKLVIFCHHIEFRKMIYNHFKKISVEAPGGMTNQKAEDVFQTDTKCRLIVGGIKSANVNMTLTAANYMAIVELPWTPGDLEQAEERIYGRLNDAHGATIYFLLAANTIEEEIAMLLDKKSKTLSKLIDGKKTKETDLLTELLKTYSRKE